MMRAMVMPSARAAKLSAIRCRSTGGANATTSSTEGLSLPSSSARARQANINAWLARGPGPQATWRLISSTSDSSGRPDLTNFRIASTTLSPTGTRRTSRWAAASSWEVIAPETLRNARSTGQICFCWYRIKVTLPPEVEGKRVFFSTVVDDYGEVWVDGRLPYKPGDTGGPIVAGFNYPNRVELKDPRPGKTYQIAIFGINGPISATPTNWIFLGPTFLELVDAKAK